MMLGVRHRDLIFLAAGAAIGGFLLPADAHAQAVGLAAGTTTGVGSVAVANAGNVASVSKWFTDLLHIGWGSGDPDRHPPAWILIVVPAILGVGLILLLSVAAGVDVTKAPAIIEAFLGGLFAGGGGAGVLTSTQNVARTGSASPPIPAAASATPAVASSADPVNASAAAPDVSPSAAPDASPDASPPPIVDPSPPSDPRARILSVAESRLELPYRLDPPPDWVQTIDCSSYVIQTYEDCGLPFEPGGFVGPDVRRKVRTAEQIRAACVPISLTDVRPGDMLFYEHTYVDTNDQPGADGKVATHIGISYGAGTLKMIDAHGDGVQQTQIGTPYWQAHLLGAGQHPSLATTPIRTDQSAISGANLQLVHAIDVSNAQPRDLAPVIRHAGSPQHVVVKLYQTVEVAGGRDWATAQIGSAQAAGCSVGGYVWLYASVPIRQQIDDACSLFAVPILWLDVEPYTDGTCPTVEQIHEALDYCATIGQRVGIYTGPWVWNRLGNPGGFDGVPLWLATYDGNPTLDVASLGGMRVVAHQYDDKLPDGAPLDCDVFDPSVTVA